MWKVCHTNPCVNFYNRKHDVLEQEFLNDENREFNRSVVWDYLTDI